MQPHGSEHQYPAQLLNTHALLAVAINGVMAEVVWYTHISWLMHTRTYTI